MLRSEHHSALSHCLRQSDHIAISSTYCLRPDLVSSRALRMGSLVVEKVALLKEKHDWKMTQS